MRKDATKLAGRFGWLVVPVLLTAALCSLPSIAYGQKGKRQAAQRKTLEGVTIRRNKATLRPGYVLVKESENIVAVKKKKKKKTDLEVITGKLKCGCVGEGSCSLSQESEYQVKCDGSCPPHGCTLLVIVEPKPTEPVEP
jgi:hypothetical protein